MTATTDVHGYPKTCDRCGQRVLAKHPAAFLTVIGPRGQTVSKHATHRECDLQQMRSKP